jgi:peptidoglycan/xylan/chitin deacetylase (PgdA/CDA1 family)
MQTPVSTFRSHLEFIAKRFEVISADETLDPPQKTPRVHLSFDDGYIGFADHAVPLLEEYGFSASVYVVSEATTNSTRVPTYIGRAAMAHCDPGRVSFGSLGLEFELSDHGSRRLAYSQISSVLKTGKLSEVSVLLDELVDLIPTDQWTEINQTYATEQVMSWDLVRRVAESGFTVGAHSKTHLSLSSQQTDEELSIEVEQSVDAVRNEVGKCDWFAYPNGTATDWSPAAQQALENAGVKGAWTLVPGVIRHPKDLDRFRLPRFVAPKSLDRFNLLLNTALIRS